MKTLASCGILAPITLISKPTVRAILPDGLTDVIVIGGGTGVGVGGGGLGVGAGVGVGKTKILRPVLPSGLPRPDSKTSGKGSVMTTGSRFCARREPPVCCKVAGGPTGASEVEVRIARAGDEPEGSSLAKN